jgi:hypothetical protein
LSGAGAGTLRETTRHFHDAVSAATRAAESLLRAAGERPGAAIIGRIRGTLLASADAPEEVRSALMQGTHAEDLSPGGFGEVGALRVVRTPPRAPAPSPPREDAAAARRRAMADERAQKQDERLRRAEHQRRRAILKKELERRERALTAAEAEAARLGQLADDAEQRARIARQRAGEAQARVEEARGARDQTKREVATAESAG